MNARVHHGGLRKWSFTSIAALALASIVALPSAAAPLPAEGVAVLLERARLWESRGRPELARELIAKSFRIAPDNPDGLAALAQLEAKAGRPDRARAALERLRRMQPSHPAIARIEGLLRIAAGDEKAKLREARQLAQQSRLPGHRHQLPKALAAYRALFPHDFPDGDIALEYWQLLAEKDGSWPEVRDGLAQLVGDYPHNPRFRLALAEHETSRLPLDRQALAVIIDMAHKPEFQRQARAAWRRAIMRLDAAPANLKYLREYLDTEPDDSIVQERVSAIALAEENRRRLMADPLYRARIDGRRLLAGDNLDAADAHFDRALRELPEDAEIAGGMGMVRLRQGHHAQALALFQQALRLQPQEAGKWQALITAAKFWGLMQEAGDARSAADYALAEDKLREAMQIDAKHVAAMVALARLRSDQGKLADAERYFRQALDAEPSNREALSGLAGLLARSGKIDEARRMSAGLTAEQRLALDKDIDVAEAGMLRQRADESTAQGRHGEAKDLLERATRLDVDDPWLRLRLARAYAADGDRAKGLALFEELLARHPNDAATLYALALFRSGGDETLAALHTLEKVAPAQRDAKITALQRGLWVRMQTQRARAAAQGGNTEAARTLLRDTEKAVGGDADLLTQVALAWIDAGELRHAGQLLDAIKRSTPTLSPQWLLNYAGVLARLGAEEELKAVLDALDGNADLAPAEAARLGEMREAAAVRVANAHLADGNAEAARASLAIALKRQPTSARLLLAQARVDLAAGQPNAAEESYRRALKANPAEAEARDGLVRLLIAKGRQDEALALIDHWQAASPPADIDTQLLLAGLLLDLKSSARAKEVVDRVLRLSPRHARAQAYAGQIARSQGRSADAINAMQLAAAAEYAESLKSGAPEALTTIRSKQTEDRGRVVEIAPADVPQDSGGNWRWKALAGMLDDRSSWLSSAIDSRERQGTPGTSQYKATEIPFEWRLPRGNDEALTFRADLVRVGSGYLDPGAAAAVNSFGTLALCRPTGICPGVPQQTATGRSFDFGYRRGAWRVDFGTTPIGFPVIHVIGGIGVRGDLGPFSYSVEASRRPLTSSLLSYAGTRDPLSGRTWGGVVASGLRLGLSADAGGALGFWSSLGAHRLTGENVGGNDRLQLMAGGYWRAINREDQVFSLGLTAMDWHFSDNLGEYSFGHGGYYSPRSYTSLSLPLTYARRFTRFSYVVRAAVSTSRSTIDPAAYYPTDMALQGAALAAGLDATYAGSASTGRGRSFHIGGEYQMDPQLFVGGRIELERSENYTPNRAVFYLRYNPDRSAAQPVALQPEPVIPTSQY